MIGHLVVDVLLVECLAAEALKLRQVGVAAGLELLAGVVVLGRDVELRGKRDCLFVDAAMVVVVCVDYVLLGGRTSYRHADSIVRVRMSLRHRPPTLPEY